MVIKRSEINYKEIVLKTIYLSAIISVAVLAPNAFQMFSLFKRRDKSRFVDSFRLKSQTKKLIRDGYIKFKNGKLVLTHKGLFELSKFKDVLIKKPKRWDKKWRVVIFDIPDKKKKSRDLLRLHLKQVGFYQMQKSVWVYPFACSEIIKLIKDHFRLGKEIVYMIVDKIEGDHELREKFKIKG